MPEESPPRAASGDLRHTIRVEEGLVRDCESFRQGGHASRLSGPTIRTGLSTGRRTRRRPSSGVRAGKRAGADAHGLKNQSCPAMCCRLRPAFFFRVPKESFRPP